MAKIQARHATRSSLTIALRNYTRANLIANHDFDGDDTGKGTWFVTVWSCDGGIFRTMELTKRECMAFVAGLASAYNAIENGKVR